MAVWEVTDIDRSGTDLTYAIRLEEEQRFVFKVSADTDKNRFTLRFPVTGMEQREINRKIFARNKRGKRVEIKKSKSLEGNFDEELSALKELVGRYRVPFFI